MHGINIKGVDRYVGSGMRFRVNIATNCHNEIWSKYRLYEKEPIKMKNLDILNCKIFFSNG